MDSKSAMVHDDFNVGLIVAENPQGLGKPRHLVPGQKSKNERCLSDLGRPAAPLRQPPRPATALGARGRERPGLPGSVRFRADRVSLIGRRPPTPDRGSAGSGTAAPCEAAARPPA